MEKIKEAISTRFKEHCDEIAAHCIANGEFYMSRDRQEYGFSHGGFTFCYHPADYNIKDDETTHALVINEVDGAYAGVEISGLLLRQIAILVESFIMNKTVPNAPKYRLDRGYTTSVERPSPKYSNV